MGEVLGRVGVRGPDRGFGARRRSRVRTESQAAGVPGLGECPGLVEVPGGRDPGAAGVPGPGVASPSGATAGVAARGGGRRPER